MTTATVPNGPYIAPGEREENGYVDSPSFAYASPLRAIQGGTPDPARTSLATPPGYRPDPSSPAGFWRRIFGEKLARHSVEKLDADGWEELKGGSGKPRAAHPRATPPPEPRKTSLMAPSTYSFTRPFDQHSARRFNGVRFSMASHRRNFPVGGMAPVHTRRNTYRADPVPWDSAIVDVPAAYEPATYKVRNVELPPGVANRSWRL